MIKGVFVEEDKDVEVLVNHVKGILWGRVGSWVITRSDSRLRLRVWERKLSAEELMLWNCGVGEDS